MKTYFKILNITILIFFGGMLLLPSLNQNLHFIAEEKGNENRTKAAKPDFDIDHLDTCVKHFDNYYTDNFNLRENFIKLLDQFELFFFGVSAVPDQVVVGKDGWFYEVKSAPNYKAANLFSENEMNLFRKDLIRRTEWAAKRGIKYYVALVPNKMDVYPEHLPSKIIKLSGITRYDQIVALNEDSGINIIDLRENILKHKSDLYDLYQHTDDHWNELGAYYGYEAIMNRLNKDFPALTALPLSDFNIQFEERFGNMAAMINAEKKYPEKFISLVAKNKIYGHEGKKRGYPVPKGISDWDAEIIRVNDNGKKLKCLIIRDSFTLLMIKFLQENFRECVFIHDAWRYRMREDLIVKEKPDIVLNIILETEIKNLINFPFILNVDQEPEEKFHLQAFNGKYVCTDNHVVIANRDNASLWETYSIIRMPNNKCAIRAYDNLFLSADLGHLNEVIANKEKISDLEAFTMIKLDGNHVAFKAANGKYLSVDEKSLQVFAKGDSIGKQEKFEVKANAN